MAIHLPFDIVRIRMQVGEHNYKNVLEEVDDALVDIKVVKLSNHSLLILQVSFVGVNQSVALVDDRSDVVKSLGVSLSL
jgi:hypothetical protein